MPRSDLSRERDTLLASIALPCTTFVALCYEIVLTRLFAYTFAYQLTVVAVSFAVFGLGVGAYLRISWLSTLAQGTLTTCAHLGVSVSLLALYAALMLTHEPIVIVGVSALPFLAAGIAVSRYYEVRSARHVATTYALDLSGAAAGCLSAVLLVSNVGVDAALLVLAIISS